MVQKLLKVILACSLLYMQWNVCEVIADTHPDEVSRVL